VARQAAVKEANMLTAPPLIGRGHPGINFSRLEVNGDLGGFVFVVGVVVTVLIGLPVTRPFLAGALAGGAIVAGVLVAWHARRTH
jgi:hypothetical protein